VAETPPARFTYLSGAALAIALSGPIFVVILAIGWTVQNLAESDTQRIGIALLLMTLPIAFAIGAILSALPILIGGWAMGKAGWRYPRTRHPLIWAIAGALLATIPAAPMDFTDEPSMLATAMLTGAICASIVRYFTRWSDDSV